MIQIGTQLSSSSTKICGRNLFYSFTVRNQRRGHLRSQILCRNKWATWWWTMKLMAELGRIPDDEPVSDHVMHFFLRKIHKRYRKNVRRFKFWTRRKPAGCNERMIILSLYSISIVEVKKETSYCCSIKSSLIYALKVQWKCIFKVNGERVR